MEVEEVQVKLEDEAKASGDTSEKVLVDKELLKVLFNILSDPTDENEENYNRFYRVNEQKEVEFFKANWDGDWYYSHWQPIFDTNDLDYAKLHCLLCPELSNLSFEEIKKLGETSAPGVHFKGKKVWDL